MLPLPPRVPSNCYGTRLLACTAIAGAVPLFFYSYDAITHREPPYVPTLGAAIRQSDLERPETRPPLVVEMPSREIAVAEADGALLTPPDGPAKVTPFRSRESKAVKVAIAPKRRYRTVIRIRPDARNAYAQSPTFGFMVPFGGY